MTARAGARRALHGDRKLLLATAQVSLHALHDRLGREVTFTDRGVERLEVGVVELRGDLRHRGRRCQLLDRHPLTPQRLDQLVATRVDGVDPALTREPLTDLRARARCLHELEPVAARTRALDLAREDLTRLA